MHVLGCIDNFMHVLGCILLFFKVDTIFANQASAFVNLKCFMSLLMSSPLDSRMGTAFVTYGVSWI